MGRTIDAHLTENEIDWLLASQAGAGSMSSPTPEDPEPVQKHLTGCPGCRQRLQLHESFMRRLRTVEGRTEHQKTAVCPADEVWAQMAAGLTPQPEAHGLLAHAAQCGYCGALLREAAEDLAGDLKPEEQYLLAAMVSAQPEGRKRLAEKLSEVSRPVARSIQPARRLFWTGVRMRWAYASGAAVLIGVAAWMLFVWQRASSPARLLAAAYSEQRTLEPRIPLASFGPMRLERGGAGGSRMNTPAALSEAEARISRHLHDNPDDPEWLALKARADLLDWNYESAMRSANRALEQQPDSLPAMIDLASAHFERAEKEQRGLDYGTAVELLGKVLSRNPDEAVALFNRAIAYEKLLAYHEALADWEHYLKLDPKGGWAEEARGRRDAVGKLLREHESRSPPRADASAFLELASQNPASVRDQDEFYLNEAITKWLPEAFSGGAAMENGPRIRAALATLAEALLSGHEDRWLQDVLAARSSPAFSQAIASLARAVSADAEGNVAKGLEEAAQAERGFEKAGSAAGVIRAKLERVYALDRSGQGLQCVDAAEGMLPRLAERGYRWLFVQLHLELAGCAGAVGRQDIQHRALAKALLLAEPSGYRVLKLRTLAYGAAIESYRGNRSKAWALDVEGLKLFWAATYPSVAVFQLYTQMAMSAENARQWNLCVAMNREAVRALSSSRNRIAALQAWFELGKAATMAGALAEARSALDSAQRFAGTLRADPAFDLVRAECQIGLATVALRDGQPRQALAHLEQARQGLTHTQNYFMISDYFEALSEARERSGQVDEAASAARSRVAVAELALASLHGERERQIWNREMAGSYYRMAESQWRVSHDPQGAMEIWERYRGAPLRAGAASPGTLDLVSLEANPDLSPFGQAKEITGTLAHQTVLSYAVLPHGLAIWVADNRGASGRWVNVSAEELRLLVSSFRTYCSEPGSDAAKLRSAARHLYDLLILPVEPQLSRDRLLLVELDPILAPIPIQALVSADGEYLGAKFAASIFPGTAYLRRLRPVTPITSMDRALVVGSPTLSGNWASAFTPLPEAADEARGIASKFTNARLLTGQRASTIAVEREMPGAAVFHYAGHSISNAARVGLLLAADGSRVEMETLDDGAPVLEASRFDASSVRSCTLAVFSACATEGVESDGAADPESLVRVFLEAGVPQVMASRWNVDSRATAVFMNAFYGHLLEGQPAALAARAAAADVRKQPDRFHPYYWAAFSVYGRG
ncbi:MAG TPA: CHAT domain-containing protein [Bryobacteraceae bacterium]|nr:CHAT domain-containing protein [Bryobacteraceae bacterium]